MDTEKLISLVQGYPVLYVTSDPDYMKSKLKDEIWKKIGTDLGLEGAVAKTRWTKLRECHREAMRRQKKKSGQKAVTIRPWTYQKPMEFVLSFMKNRNTASNVTPGEPDSADENNDETQLDDPSDTIGNDPEQQEPLETPAKKIKKDCFPESSTITKAVPKNKSTKNSPVEEFLKNCEVRAKQREEAKEKMFNERQVSTEKDALYHFFMSMYITTKELPMPYQQKIRNEIFQIVTRTEDQYELDTTAEEPIRVTPTTSTYASTSSNHSNFEALSEHFPDYYIASPSLLSNQSSVSPTMANFTPL